MGAVCSCCPCGTKVAPISPERRKMTTISRLVQRSPTPTQLSPSPIPTRRSATPIPTQSFSGSPFSRSGISKGNSLNLIRGFENEPLVSLEEALAPFHGKIDHLSDYIKEAKKKCHYPSENDLTPDESAAIYIYTRKWGNGCLYDHLQAAWDSNKPSEMKPWFKYLKLFKTAYDKLPTADEEIWQGKPFDPRLQKELDTDSAPLYAAMDIFSPSKKSVERYLSTAGANEKILIGFQGIGAKLPGAHAADTKYGALVFPGSKLGISNVEQTYDVQSIIYHLVGPKPIEQPLKQSSATTKHYACPGLSQSHSIFTRSFAVIESDLFHLLAHEIIEYSVCTHRCSGKHKPNHCHGFDVLFHNCEHHCGVRHKNC